MNYRFKQNIYELSKSEYIQEDWYYCVYGSFGKHRFLRRNEAFDFYKDNKGTRIDIVSKDNDGVRTIVNCPNMDLERVRDDFTIKKTNKSTRKAIQKYDKKNTTKICLKLNKNTDKELIDYLSMIDNKNGFIKELIKKEMQKQYTYMYENAYNIRVNL